MRNKGKLNGIGVSCSARPISIPLNPVNGRAKFIKRLDRNSLSMLRDLLRQEGHEVGRLHVATQLGRFVNAIGQP